MSKESFGGVCVSCSHLSMFNYEEIKHNDPNTDEIGDCCITGSWVKAGDGCVKFETEFLNEVRARMKKLSMMKTNVKKDTNKAKKGHGLFKGV